MRAQAGALLIVLAETFGATINVATGNELFNAVASSSSGDRIIVADGTVDMDTRNRGALWIEHPLTIQAKNPRGAILVSGFDPSFTAQAVLDEQGNIVSAATTVASMIHVGFNQGQSNAPRSTMHVTLEGLIIRGARASNQGGAIYHDGMTLTVRDCLFDDHLANAGGSIYSTANGADPDTDTVLNVYDTEIKNSKAVQIGGAFRFYNQNSAALTVTLRDVTFTANTVTADAATGMAIGFSTGMAIYIDAAAGDINVELERVKFRDHDNSDHKVCTWNSIESRQDCVTRGTNELLMNSKAPKQPAIVYSTLPSLTWKCPLGKWMSEGPVYADFDGCAYDCLPGTYGASQLLTAPDECTACPAGTTSAAGSSSKGDCTCPAGRYWEDPDTCSVCPEGKSSYVADATECVCPVNFFADAYGFCVECDATQMACNVNGVTVATLPVKSSFWRMSNTSLAVEKCYTDGACTGAYSTVTQHRVKVSFTAAGLVSDFAEGSAASDAVKSGLATTAGVSTSAVTLRVTAASVNIEASIVVADAAAADLAKSSVATAMTDKSTSSALLGIAVETIPAVETATAQVTEVMSPPPTAPSPPPEPSRRLEEEEATALVSSDTFGDGLCRTGHSGPYCEVCVANYYKQSDKLCYDCASAEGNVGGNIALAVGLVVGVLLLLLLFLCRGFSDSVTELLAGDLTEDGLEGKIEESAAQGGKLAWALKFVGVRTRLKITMSLIQVMSSIGTVFEIAFPPIFGGMMKWLGVLQLDVFTALPVACITSGGFHTVLLLQTLVPLAVMLVLAVWGVLLIRKGDTKTKKGASRVVFGDILINFGFLILTLVYPSVSKNIFATFQCKDIGDGTRFLRADLSINCASPAHTTMSIYAAVMLLVFPFGAPMLYAYLLFRKHGTQLFRLRDIEMRKIELAKKAVASDQYDKSAGKSQGLGPGSNSHREEVQPRIDELEAEQKLITDQLPGYIRTLSESGYSLMYFYFEIAESFRKLSLVGLPVFFTAGDVSQLIFALMICFTTFGLYSLLQPYKEWEDNAFAILTQVIIFFSLISSIALKTASPTGSIGRAMDYALTLLFCTPILFEVWIDVGFSCKNKCSRKKVALQNAQNVNI